MRIVFVYYVMDVAGSARDVNNYVEAGKALGHEIVVFGPNGAHPSFRFSPAVDSCDAAVFLFEWTTELRYGDHLDLARLLATVPRERRVVIDCDANYNEPIACDGDFNHRDQASARWWTDVCDRLADKICQPTLHPQRRNVTLLLFYAYDSRSEAPIGLEPRDYGMTYVGHSKFRWGPMSRVLRAVEPIRPQVGRIGLVGHGWDGVPAWADEMGIADAYYTDQAYLRKLRVEILPEISFEQVIPQMSRATFNPVLSRPLFDRLGLVSPRLFETPAAGTIPLFFRDPADVRNLHGEDALDLVLGDDATDKIRDVIETPERYAEIVTRVRAHLAERHSYAARLRQLIEIVES